VKIQPSLARSSRDLAISSKIWWRSHELRPDLAKMLRSRRRSEDSDKILLASSPSRFQPKLTRIMQSSTQTDSITISVDGKSFDLPPDEVRLVSRLGINLICGQPYLYVLYYYGFRYNIILLCI